LKSQAKPLLLSLSLLGKVMEQPLALLAWLTLLCELKLTLYSKGILLINHSTSAYEGTAPDDDTTQVEYSPIIETMISKDLIAAPLFSLAILRDVSGYAGYLALGGVPPISFTQTWTSTPILVTTISGYPDTYDFYTINIDEVVLNGAAVSGSGGASIEYIVSPGSSPS
jgi:hypothetical protein